MPPRGGKSRAAPSGKSDPQRQGSLPFSWADAHETASDARSKRGDLRENRGLRLRAWVDGGARGNPGPAGYGARIEDAEGRLVREASGYLGVATNNVAEYSGLIAALEGALELGADSLEVHADSELMVRQMNGQYKVKNEKLKPLFAKAKGLASRLVRFTIRHIPREQNREADRLANEAMDRGN